MLDYTTVWHKDFETFIFRKFLKSLKLNSTIQGKIFKSVCSLGYGIYVDICL
jgi:hypothetical protein